jgi:hypothetical protein
MLPQVLTVPSCAVCVVLRYVGHLRYGKMCYTAHAIRCEQVVRLGVKQALESWLCQFETCT